MESDSRSDVQLDDNEAKGQPVRFVGVSGEYCADRDVKIVIQFGPQFGPTIDDWVGLFPLGWRSLKQRATYQWISTGRSDSCTCTVTIPKFQLLTNVSQYYQFVYVGGNDTVLSISNPVFFTRDAEEFVVVDVKEEDNELGVLKEEDEDARKETVSNLSIVKCASSTPRNSISISPQKSDLSTPQTSIVLTPQVSTAIGCEKSILIVPKISNVNKSALISREIPHLMSSSSVLGTTMSSSEDDASSPSPLLYSFSTVPLSTFSSSLFSVGSSPQSHYSFSPTSAPPPTLPPSPPADAEDDSKSAGDNNTDTNDATALVPWIERRSVVWTPTPVVVLSVRQVDVAKREVDAHDSARDKCNFGSTMVEDDETISDTGPLAPIKSRTTRKPHVRLEARSRDYPLDEPTDLNLNWVSTNGNKDAEPTVLSDDSSGASTASSLDSDPSKTTLGKKISHERKDAHLDQVIVRFFHFLGSVIARQTQRGKCSTESNEKLSSCSRCSRLEVDLQSVKSRASQAERREGSLVQELINIKKKVKQQETRTLELLNHIQQQNDDSKTAALFKSQLTQCLSDMQQATHNINRLALEKKNLEIKVGNLMWEKAALYAKLQVLQQGEVRYTRKATELSNALMEAQEEVHHLSKRQAESQRFIDGLLATLASLGFICVRDPSGVGVNLDNVTGPGLALEPAVDVSGFPKWSRKPRFSDKWYKAMMESRETIKQLQSQIEQLEEQGRQRGETRKFKDIQKSLTEEKKRSKNLQEQINAMMLMMANRAGGSCEDSTSSELKRELSGSSIISHDKLNYTVQEAISSEHALDVPTRGTVYESQGARPKILKFAHRSCMCEPADELDVDGQPAMRPRLRTACTYSPSSSTVGGYGYAPNCPYCGEIFPQYLLPADRQEHIRMHMYSELQRKHYIHNGI